MNHTNAEPLVLISGVDTDSDDEFEDASALDGIRPTVSHLQAVLEAATLSDLQAALKAASFTAPSAPSDSPASTTTAQFLVGAPLRVRSVPITATPISGYVQITSAARFMQTGNDLLKTNSYIVAEAAPQLFSLMDLHNPSLDSLVDLHANLEVVSRHFIQYDLYDVFRLVKPLPAPPTAFFTDMSAAPPTISVHLAADRPDLFTQYGVLKLMDVLASNAWFRTWSADPWICSNLELSASYLYARMAPDLRSILRTKHEAFPPAQQGGPLLLYLLINQVVAANESVGRVLVDRLSTVTISSYPAPPTAFFTDMSAAPPTISVHLAADRPDLFTQYGVLKLMDVLASNAWFRTWSADPWICSNLELSASYLYARMPPDLRSILRTKHDAFPPAQQGGPLLLYLLINQVVAANESVGRVLVDRLSTVTISSYPGEDISKVVTHLRALVRSLKAIRRRDVSGVEISFIPSNLSKRLYAIFATASCPAFTSYFATRFTAERNAELFDVDLRALVRSLKAIRRRDVSGVEISFIPSNLSKRLYAIFATASCPAFTSYFATRFTAERNAELFDVDQTYAWTDAELLLSTAERLYHDLLTTGDWHGTKQNHATFPAFTSPTDAAAFLTRVHCHNCDGPHLLRVCPQPRDEARISANRKRMDKTRKLARKTAPASTPASTAAPAPAPATSTATPARRSKWPPRPKRGEPTDAIIDGRPFFFHFKKGRWVPSVRSASAPVAPPTVTAAPVPSVNIATPSAPLSVITTGPTVAVAAPPVAVAAAVPEPDAATLAARRLHAQMLLTKFQEDFNQLCF
ncbi:hypothetical protein IV203_019160 [Nitzschia inconspicua]|uniref:Uncharacterized protein n=1 Tax=Nitzschia inconspicua TaxID=303405 RepID=A0A9K3LZA9_9STRA|nr:hypothetical protein IV203_019160 [Nitzschia inconspicua]